VCAQVAKGMAFYSRGVHGGVEGFAAKGCWRIYCGHGGLSSAGVRNSRGGWGSGSAGALARHVACAAPPAGALAWARAGR
jgi:hypothetical protein